VCDAPPLAIDAADRPVNERRRGAERRGAERAPDDDLVEVAGRRARGEDAEDDAEQPGDDRAATDPTLVARPRPDPAGDAEDADEDGHRSDAGGERREGQPEGERA